MTKGCQPTSWYTVQRRRASRRLWQRHALAWFNNLPVEDPRFEQVQLAAIAEDYSEYDAEPLQVKL